MRDTKALHPELQEKLKILIDECSKNGIKIKIGECVRTVAEQDALYAQGRTKPGNKVTNAKGSSYSSQHQWGIAADFYLDQDIDGDGSKADDAFNNSKHTFDKVGSIAKLIGLGWGGDWKSPVDLPHLYLPDWGSTTSKLKSLHGTPEKFMATWKKTSNVSTAKTDQKKEVETYSKSTTEVAKSKDSKYSKSYTTTANLNLRCGAGADKGIIDCIEKNTKVTCYGYYTKVGTDIWLLVQCGKCTGFVFLKYLK